MPPCWPRRSRPGCHRWRGRYHSSSYTCLKWKSKKKVILLCCAFCSGVFSPTVKAHVSRRTDEESLQEVSVCQFVDVRGDVDLPAGDRDRPAKPEDSIQVKGGHLSVVALVVAEVEVVRQRLLKTEAVRPSVSLSRSFCLLSPVPWETSWACRGPLRRPPGRRWAWTGFLLLSARSWRTSSLRGLSRPTPRWGRSLGTGRGRSDPAGSARTL